MKLELAVALQRAGARVRANDPLGATRILQGVLLGREEPEAPPAPGPAGAPANGERIAGIDRAECDAEASRPEEAGHDARERKQPDPEVRPHRPLGATLRLLEEGRAAMGFPAPAYLRLARAPEVPAGARFEARTFACAEGSRDYRLFVPSRAEEGLRGLLVMLHGCKQNADDFAAGTAMNDRAEREGLLVAYPCQSTAQNALGCWNWFNPDNQRRDSGEPAIIAGIARSLLEEFPVERSRAMVAGLSAGGAMAAVLGATYPDIFGSVGVHSGLPYGVAHDAATALAVMRGDAGSIPATAPSCRMIVFHGDADRTVHPDNAGRVLAAAGPGEVRTETGTSAGGRPCRIDTLLGPDGAPRIELWMVESGGHAWYGGNPAGSYTDPDGPDASAEMVRFLLSG